MDILQQGMSDLGFTSDEVSLYKSSLEKYGRELELFNSAYDLVGTDSQEDIIIRHILDSLAPYQVLKQLIAGFEAKETVSFVDIGSGGGLPGIPLSIVFPGHSMTLLERMSKRCAFLENCVAVLGLKNVSVKNDQAERAFSEQFDIAVFRAFRPLDKKMAKIVLRLVAPSGYLCAYKGKMEKIEIEMDAIKSIIPQWRVEKLSVPFLEKTERHVVIVQK